MSNDAPLQYEQRYTVRLGGVPTFNFVRRPVSTLPADGTICFADAGPRHGTISNKGAAMFKDGKWTNPKGKPLSYEPTHWTVLAETQP